MSNVLKVLCRAVEDRRCAVIRYRDQHLIRVVEPHAIYTNPKGEVVLDCYQTRGYTESGKAPPFWQNFRLGQIRSAFLLGERFVPRLDEGFDPDKIQYSRGRIAVVEIPVIEEPETMAQTESVTRQARSLFGKIGHTIDSILSNPITLNKTH